MTLILSCLTARYVLQVSDRRLVFVRPDETLALAEDDATKAIVVDRRLIFTYTGWALLEGVSTNFWFAHVMKPFVDTGRLGDGIAEVARRASIHFGRQVRYPPERRLHTFVGVGWAGRRSARSLVPVAIRITNAFDDQCRPLSAARRDFVVQWARLQRSSGVWITSDGQPLDPWRKICVQRLLRRQYYLRAARNCGRLLAKELASVADELGPTGPVGKNLLVTCLPKAAVLRLSLPILGPPDDTAVSTFYVPAVGTQQIRRSATIVARGFPVLLSDVGITIPPPADGSDPYLGWR